MAAMVVGLRFYHPTAVAACSLIAQKLACHFSSGVRVTITPSSSPPPPNSNRRLQPPIRLLLASTTTPHRRKSTLQCSASATAPPPLSKDSPLSGLEDVMLGYFLGNHKATQVAHSVWEKIVQKGDTLVDATCGNGYDTLAMAKIVSQMSPSGHVCAMDVQQAALETTSSLLDESLNSDERRLVELFATCHSNMEDVVPKSSPVRLVAFNLGYLPGGDKTMITRSETTLKAMEAATRVLAPGGLISLVVYVGHPGGREEFDAVEAFASKLPAENWICCKLQMLNRPLAPVLVLLFKR